MSVGGSGVSAGGASVLAAGGVSVGGVSPGVSVGGGAGGVSLSVGGTGVSPSGEVGVTVSGSARVKVGRNVATVVGVIEPTWVARKTRATTTKITARTMPPPSTARTIINPRLLLGSSALGSAFHSLIRLPFHLVQRLLPSGCGSLYRKSGSASKGPGFDSQSPLCPVHAPANRCHDETGT